MSEPLFDPWKPLFGGYMPLSLLVSYRRDRGGLLATVLLEMWVAGRVAPDELESARRALPPGMPEAYDALPQVLDDLLEVAEATRRRMIAADLRRPRTPEEAAEVRALIDAVVLERTGAPFQTRWRPPPHLRAADEAGAEAPPRRGRESDPASGRRTASVPASVGQRSAPPVEDSGEAKRRAAPRVLDPFAGTPRVVAPASADPTGSDGAEETTLVVSPGELAARFQTVVAEGAAMEIGSLRGWETGAPTEVDLEEDPAEAPAPPAAPPTPAPGGSLGDGPLSQLVHAIEEGVELDLDEAAVRSALPAWRGRVLEAITGLGAGGEAVPRSVLVRVVDTLLTVQQRAVQAAAAPEQARLAGVEDALAALVTQIERLAEGRPASREVLRRELPTHPSAVEAVFRLSEQVQRWREAPRRPAVMRGHQGDGLDASARVAALEDEARELRVVAAWGHLRAMLAELREEVAEVVEPRDLFERPSLTDDARRAQLLSRWEELHRYLRLLRARVPEGALAREEAQAAELRPFMDALTGRGAEEEAEFLDG